MIFLRNIICVSFFLLTITSSAQVFTYRKVKKVNQDKFNYQRKIQTKNSSDLKLIYSDRIDNVFYTSPYITEKTKKTKSMLTPMYVIGEHENAYEVVLADPKQIGKPKGIFSKFFSGKYSFKDAKSVEYLGWIPRNNIIKYNHSFLEPSNNKPIKYKLGTTKVKRLFDTKPYMEVDSVFVFKDPFLKNKNDKKLVSNQIVYPYKYNQTKKTVFISDKPVLKDSINQITGWIPANLITPIGQGKVYIVEKNNQLKIRKNLDTLTVNNFDRYSKYVYFTGRDSTSIDKDSLITPINVWNHNRNKLINVNGNNLYTKEIPIIEEESKIINIHFISDVSEASSIKILLNSLQNLYISLFEKPGEFQYNFSAVLIDKHGQTVLQKTSSFAKWIDFIENSIILQNNFTNNENYVYGRKTITEAIDYSLNNFSNNNNKFDNNIFIVCSSKENVKNLGNPSFHFFERLAKKSPKILFAQLENKSTNSYQNYILASKEFLYKTSEQYNEFIKEYIVDNEILVEANRLKSIELENDNAYVYDAPKNSLFNGGIVFPKIEKKLTPLSLEIVVDSILKRSDATNKKLISSLVYFNKKLGVLRSKPTQLLENILKAKLHYSDTLTIQDIERNNLHEVLYQKVSFVNDSTLKSGYILSKQEILNLIDDYRTIFPKVLKPITKEKRRKIKKLSLKQMRILNKAALRKVLNRKLTFADLFYTKSGIPLNHKGFHCLRITKLPRRFVLESGFQHFYLKHYKMIDDFEELFLKNKLQKIKKGYRDEVYFIPIELLP